MKPEELAEHFHTTYEALAPQFFPPVMPGCMFVWEELHPKHQQLLIAVCAEMLNLLESERDTKAWEDDLGL